jgi:hypothetical protein
MVWNIILTKFQISQSIPCSLSDNSCFLCSYPTDPLPQLFFTCPIARVVWCQSFWPLDTIALNVTNMTDWLLIILHLHRMLGVPPAETHKFQIFAVVACDYLWFTKNKAHHDGTIPNALSISTTINKTALEHYSAWTTKYDKTPKVWKSPSPPYFKINYDTAIRATFSA